MQSRYFCCISFICFQIAEIKMRSDDQCAVTMRIEGDKNLKKKLYKEISHSDHGICINSNLVFSQLNLH